MKFHLPLQGLAKSEEKLTLIRFLLKHEASMSEREIASLLGISHMSVNRTMQELAGINMVGYRTVGKAHLWQVNRTSYAYRAFKQLLESVDAIPKPLKELENMILANLPKNLVDRAVLFGSVAKAEEQANSDIDLFILVKNAVGRKKIEGAVEQLSNRCLEVFGNRLSPYILTQQQFKERKNLEIIREIEKGIQLYPQEKGA